MTSFLLVAAAMLALAVLFVARPLLARGASADATKRDALDRARKAGVLSESEYAAKLAALQAEASDANGTVAQESGRPVLLAVAVSLVVTVGAIAAYRIVGNPAALDPAARAPRAAASGAAGAPASPEAEAPALEDAIAGLAKRLEQNPDDAQGWMLLGRAHKAMQRFDEAKAALENAHRVLPDDVDVMVELAEARALASPDHRLAPADVALIERALAADPAHQRGQWIRGIAALQDERYEEAVAIWERLLPQLPADSDVAKSVMQQIAAARERGGLPPMASAPEVAAAEPAAPLPAAGGPKIEVQVDIAPELATQVAPGDVLFVFARAPTGPKMPLAIQRIPAGEFPITVTLDDSMGMMPTLKLSQAGQVVVGARISKSGDAAGKPGDLEVISEPMAPSGAIRLVIANVVQ